MKFLLIKGTTDHTSTYLVFIEVVLHEKAEIIRIPPPIIYRLFVADLNEVIFSRLWA